MVESGLGLFIGCHFCDAYASLFGLTSIDLPKNTEPVRLVLAYNPSAETIAKSFSNCINQPMQNLYKFGYSTTG
jgi:hypothetical protein